MSRKKMILKLLTVIVGTVIAAFGLDIAIYAGFGSATLAVLWQGMAKTIRITIGQASGTGGNSGTMIVDATCAPSNIRYPQDVSLLNEARENAEKLLDVLHDPAEGKKPRTYRKRARKDYLKYLVQ